MVLRILFAMSMTLAVGCVSVSTSNTEIGMSEKAWRRRTVDAALVGNDVHEKIYRSGGTYFHFRDGKLVKVDQGTSQVDISVVDQ